MLERPRLFAGLSSAPLVVIHAPAGYGKTVAAVQRAERLRSGGSAVIWLSGREYAERYGEDGGLLLVEELEAETRRLEAPTTAIVDEYEHVTSVETDLALAQLLSLGERLSLIVVSRRLAALDGPVADGRVALARITESELRFSDDETASLAAAEGVSRVDLVSQLQRFCDGWPLPIAAVLRSAGSETRGPSLLKRAASFAHQMYELLPSDELRRVLLAAVAGDFATPAQIARLVGIDERECVESLLALESEGLVRRAWYADGVRIAGHPGVREPLEDRAQAEFGAQRLREWRIEGALAISRIEPEVALTRLLRSEAYEESEEVLSSHFLEVIEGENTLLHQLRGVPRERLAEYPVLIAVRLQLEQIDPRSDPALVKQLFKDMKQRVAESFVVGSASRNIASEIVALAMLSVGERMRGSGESLPLARELQRRLEANRGGPLAPIERTLPYVHAVAGYGGIVNGDLELAERGFRSVLQTAEELGDVDELLRGFYGVALAKALSGNIRDAEEHLELAREHRLRTGATPPHGSWLNRALAELLIAIERLDVEAFSSAAAEAWPWLDRAEAWPHFLIAENTMERLMHGRFRAHELMEEQRARIGEIFVTVPNLRNTLGAGIATMHMLAGDYRTAERELAKFSRDHQSVIIARVRLALLSGSPEPAIEAARAVSERGTNPRAACSLLLLGAIAEWQSGDREAAIRTASSLADTMVEHEIWSAVGLVPYAPIAEIAEELAERGDPRLREFVERPPEIARFEPYERLSQAEMRIVGVLPECETVGAIADRLFLSPNTVKSHLKQIYRKLRVSKRAEAIDRAVEIGLITLPG